MSSFCKCKSYSHFFSKNISIYAIFNDQSFNNTLTYDIISFEQLGPDYYCLYPNYLDRQARTDSVDSDQMPIYVASDQGLYCLSIIQQFLDTSTSSKVDLFKF